MRFEGKCFSYLKVSILLFLFVLPFLFYLKKIKIEKLKSERGAKDEREENKGKEKKTKENEKGSNFFKKIKIEKL